MDNPQGGTQLLDLGSYLIMPVQRLPRYELLLREVREGWEGRRKGEGWKDGKDGKELFFSSYLFFVFVS